MKFTSLIQLDRIRLSKGWYRLGVLAVLWVVLGASSPALGQGTTISYQGQLTRAGAPAEGTYDLQFALYPSFKAAGAIGSTVTLPEFSVHGGRFTVDADGVALAAIQGLNLKVQQLDGRNRELEKLNRDLLQTLQRVERRLIDLESNPSSSGATSLRTTSSNKTSTRSSHE